VKTFGQLKSEIRLRVFPTGEADNLVVAHDKDFIDALIDLQTWVVCLQQDNTDLFPQCSTTYNCGLTVLPAPRGIIKKLSVMDKIDPITGYENPDVDDDYCSEIPYTEVDFCHVRRYMSQTKQCGSCPPTGLFFCLPFTNDRPYPTPTDEGVPAGMPALPMGFHYPQASTDRTWGRAGAGIWAKDRGNIYIAPWIQSTETVILKWDGVKRTWNDADPVDDDPLLSKALEEYVRWQHAKKWDADDQAAANAAAEFNNSRIMLIRQCREETRVRVCEPSFARASSVGLATLYYNDEDKSFTATCPDGATGDPSTVTIYAGTVGSNISISDANNKAAIQAKSQAEARLVCTATPTLYWNTVAGFFVATCQKETGAPDPTGSPSTGSKAIGTVSSTENVEDANTQAQAQAIEEAQDGLSCTFYNRAVTGTKACPDGTNEQSVTIPAKALVDGVPAYVSTGPGSSQAAADSLAQIAANNQAIGLFAGTVCDGGPPAGTIWNTVVVAVSAARPCVVSGSITSITQVRITVPAGTFASTSLYLANKLAHDMAQPIAEGDAIYLANAKHCGVYNFDFPGNIPPELR
jgi:hypothetical protein